MSKEIYENYLNLMKHIEHRGLGGYFPEEDCIICMQEGLMILKTKKLNFSTSIEVDLPEWSIPIELKTGKGEILTLWYWENTTEPTKIKKFYFRLFKKLEEEENIGTMRRLGSIWIAPNWFQVYQV